jgi:hypothetical protein
VKKKKKKKKSGVYIKNNLISETNTSAPERNEVYAGSECIHEREIRTC